MRGYLAAYGIPSVVLFTICMASPTSPQHAGASSPSISETTEWLANHLPTSAQALDDYDVYRAEASYSIDGCTIKIKDRWFDKSLSTKMGDFSGSIQWECVYERPPAIKSPLPKANPRMTAHPGDTSPLLFTRGVITKRPPKGMALGFWPVARKAANFAVDSLNGKRHAEQIKPFDFTISCHVAKLGRPIGIDPERFHLIAP